MPKPTQKTTFEDVQRELGLDKMSFASEMLRPDQHEERAQDAAQMPPAQSRTPEDQQIIDLLEWDLRRKLTPEEIHLALKQARST